MNKIINFEKAKIKNLINKFVQDKGMLLESEILFSVIQFVFLHSDENVVQEPFEDLGPDVELEHVFGGNRTRFAAAFRDLVNYWELTLFDEEIPENKEFETFTTMVDLCEFIDQKVKNL